MAACTWSVVPIASAILLSAPAAFAFPASAVVIDFETTPDGQIPLEGEDASLLWDAQGVTFYLVGSLEPPVIATEGAPTQGYVWRDAANTIFRDQAVSGVNTLSDPWGTADTAEIGVAFDMPVDSVAITVIDFGEATGGVLPGEPQTLSLQAFDADGVLVDEDVFTIPAFSPTDPADGNVAELSVSAPSIAWVETVGVVSDWGVAVDDVAYTLADADEDGVVATDDLCPDTVTDADAGVPSRWLGRNRWADLDGDGTFEAGWGWGSWLLGTVDMQTTGGCSCADIIDELGLGRGAERYGCHTWSVALWTWLYVP